MVMQQKEEGWDRKRGFNIAHMLCVIHQRALVIPMRKNFGKEALGWPCVLAVVLMFLWTIATRDSLMWGWMGIWFLCLLFRRVESIKLARSGARVHRQYDGWPVDGIRVQNTERMAKLVGEPILVGLAGAFLYWFYGQQGWRPNGLPYFILTGVFTLPFVELVKQTIWEKRTQAMVDARIEHEATMRDFRDRYGDF